MLGQTGIGLDVVSDGETGKIGYSTYVRERLSGFGGDFTPKPNRDLADHPEFRRRMALYLGSQPFKRVCCIGAVTLKDPQAVHTDVTNFLAALNATPATEGFLNAASPGVVASFLPNRHYPNHESYVHAVAEAMRSEYETIAAAGLVLQVDCPDLAMSRHTGFQDLDDEEFLRIAAINVEALNSALANIPAPQVRIHICWGNHLCTDIKRRRGVEAA